MKTKTFSVRIMVPADLDLYTLYRLLHSFVSTTLQGVLWTVDENGKELMPDELAKIPMVIA